MKWLQRLSDICTDSGAFGRYTNPSLSVGDPRGGNSLPSVIRQDTLPRVGVSQCLDGEDSDGDVQYIGRVKDLFPPPLISLTSTQTTQTSSQLTLRDTFKELSCTLTQTLTQTTSNNNNTSSSHAQSRKYPGDIDGEGMSQRGAMKVGGGGVGQTRVREVEFEQVDAYLDDLGYLEEDEYVANKMNLDLRKSGFDPEKVDCRVTLRERPFAQGGERVAYHMFMDDRITRTQLHMVAKESRLQEHFKDRLKFHMVLFCFCVLCFLWHLCEWDAFSSLSSSFLLLSPPSP